MMLASLFGNVCRMCLCGGRVTNIIQMNFVESLPYTSSSMHKIE